MGDDLTTLIQARYPVIFLKTWEEARACETVRNAARSLRMPFFTWSCTNGLCADGRTDRVYDTVKPTAFLAHVLEAQLEAVYFLKDFRAHLEDATTLRMVRDIAGLSPEARPVLVLCGPDDDVPTALEKDAIRHDFAPPARADLQKLVHQCATEAQNRCRTVQVALTRQELDQLVSHLEGMTFGEAERIVRMILGDCKLSPEDVREVIRHKQTLVEQSGILELIQAPAFLDEVGGLSKLKEWLVKRSQAFSGKARELGLQPPKGVLLLGVQGCGKSLCAKAIASAWGMTLAKFDPSTLYDKYIGETEKNLKKALKHAEMLAPAVLWIDEIEKALSAGGGESTDGGLSRRILGTFLSWMQDRRSPVFLAATSNDISALPPELLRKGRFDEIFFVDLPKADVRKTIFQIHLKKRRQKPEAFDLDKLAAATEGASGAEIEQAVIDSLYEVLSGRALTTELLLERIAATRPLSVVMEEKVSELRDWAAERTVPAD